MYETMYEAPGVGLAAPAGRRAEALLHLRLGENGPHVIVNPEIVESTRRVGVRRGLPVGARASRFEIVRPKVVTVRGLDLDGNEIVLEGDDCSAG